MLEKYLGFPANTHHYIFIGTLVLIAISLPLSLFGLSLGLIILSANWLVEGNFNAKWHTFKQKKSIALFLSIYFVHVIALIYSSNFDYALHDLKIKLPLLSLPIVLGTSPKLKSKIFSIVLVFFVLANITASLILTYIYLGFTKIEIVDPRYMSIFISHIRFALMLVLSIVIITYYFIQGNIGNNFIKILCILALIWLVVFLFILNSYTGLVLLLIFIPILLLHWVYTNYKIGAIFYLVVFVNILFVFFSGVYGYASYKKFNSKHDLPADKLIPYTVNGNGYYHNPLSAVYENGHKVWTFICFKEVKSEWNKRSSFDYEGEDKQGQKLKITLFRYLTSKELAKDSVGVWQLSEKDIQHIENGTANYLYTKKFALYPRIHKILWQLAEYKGRNEPGGKSIIQRLIYLETGYRVFKKNILFGTGTGDIDDAFKAQYKADKTKLERNQQNRTHNQFFTFAITFGLVGFVWIAFAFWGSIYLEKRNIGFLFIAFLVIALLSMINEDTLETHTGASFSAFFYSFLLYHFSRK